MVPSTDAPRSAGRGTPSRPGRTTVYAAVAAALVALVAVSRLADASGEQPPEHLQALLPVPAGYPPGWWSLELTDGAAQLMAPTGTTEHIGEVVRLDDQLELGPAPGCGDDGGSGLYEVVRDGEAWSFEAMGPDGCPARQEVLTAGTWHPHTPPPMTTRLPDLRPARVLAAVPVDGEAARLAVLRGSVWVATVASRHLYRIDAATNTVTEAVDIGYADRIPGLAAGNGSLWASNWLRSTVARIDATTGEVTATVEVGLEPPGGLLAEDGQVWVANGHDGTVTRVDESGETVLETVEVGEPGDGGPQDLVSFDGRVLVSVPRENAIMSLDPRTGEASRFYTGRLQSRLDATQDAVWTFEGMDADWVTRIGADGVADLRIGVGDGRRPRALATAGDVVWVLTVGESTPAVDLELLRIDARTGEVTDRLGVEHLAGRHDVVLDEGGDVWVTAVDEVLRIDGSA